MIGITAVTGEGSEELGLALAVLIPGHRHVWDSLIGHRVASRRWIEVAVEDRGTT